MKRLIIGLISAAFILAPMSASALEMMSDKNMKDVTGQAGVSIALDDVVLFQTVDYTKYTDTDGVGTTDLGATDTSASVYISGRTTLKLINAIAPMDNAAVSGAVAAQINGNADGIGDIDAVGTYNYASVTANGNTVDLDYDYATTNAWEASPLTIDVGKAGLISIASASIGGSDDIAGVIIGLPTVEINTSADTYDVGITRGTTMDESNRMIRIEKGDSTMAVLGGHIEIAAH
ncbi:MAG: hypothetical protein K9K82_13340 [Desulfobacteraceae bacterium]|nr:hypothetical protein [Desulfobacteraceae bacterium]